MKIFSSNRMGAADPATFTGKARAELVASVDLESDLKIYRVDFQPGARTHWHRHTGPQLLVILEGECRVQSSGQPAGLARAGDTVLIPPGEKHWHGAGEASAMSHLAINLNAKTEWLEPVSDSDYRVP